MEMSEPKTNSFEDMQIRVRVDILVWQTNYETIFVAKFCDYGIKRNTYYTNVKDSTNCPIAFYD
jgi:hypothetical protein